MPDHNCHPVTAGDINASRRANGRSENEIADAFKSQRFTALLATLGFEAGEEVLIVPQEIKATLTVAGSYDQLSKFIVDLERTIRPIKITTMNLSGSDTSTRAIIEMTTYYQPAKTVNITEKELRR